MFLDFPREDGLESGAATKMDAESGGMGEGGIQEDRGGLLLAGEVGLGALFHEVGKGGVLGTNEVQGGGSADLVEGLADKLFFPVDFGLLQKLKKLAFLGTSGADLGQGVRGITSDLLRGILEEGEEPLAHWLFETGLVGLRKTGSHSTDERYPVRALLGAGLIKTRDLFLPKLDPGE